jgi:hypothetical protein
MGGHCLRQRLAATCPNSQVQDDGKLLEMVKRGGGLSSLEAKQSIERAIDNGRGGLFLKLNPEQYAKLKG